MNRDEAYLIVVVAIPQVATRKFGLLPYCQSFIEFLTVGPLV